MVSKRLVVHPSASKNNRTNFLMLTSVIIILVGIAFIVVNRENFLAAIPGFYQVSEYTQLINERDTIIDKNNQLIGLNTNLIVEANKLSFSSSDFKKKQEYSLNILENLNKIIKNHEEVSVVDDKLLKLRLISGVYNYVTLLSESNKETYEARKIEVNINNTRNLYYKYRENEALFGECVAGINRSETQFSASKEKQIAYQINECIKKIESIEKALTDLETFCQAKLDLNRQYINNSKQFWTNSYYLHQYLGENNTTKAEEYNNKAATLKRTLTDMDMIQVFNEINEKILNDKLAQVQTFLDSADTKQNSANTFFDQTLK